jgi:ABC-type branched-subunit amino acid transport system substrate-binding protein
VTLALVAACAGDGGDGGREAARVGLLTPYTGSLQSWGGARRRAFELAVAEIEESGGLGGRALQIAEGDTQSTVAGATSAARALIDSGVQMLAGPSPGVAAGAVLGLAAPAGVVQFTPTTAGEFYDDPGDLMFGLVKSLRALSGAVALHYHEQGLRTAVFLSVDFFFAQELVSAWQEAGITTRFAAYPALEDSQALNHDFAPYIEDALASRPDIIFLNSLGAEKAALLVATYQYIAAQSDYAPLITMEPSLVRDFVGGVDDRYLLPLRGVHSVVRSDTATFTAFRERYEARFAEPLTDTGAALWYDTAYLLALAAVAAGREDGRAVAGALRGVSRDGTAVTAERFADARAALQRGEDVDYLGASGGCDLDEQGAGSDLVLQAWRVVAGPDGTPQVEFHGPYTDRSDPP